jgi:Polyketide cyclase / dehydrase and lipid transport
LPATKSVKEIKVLAKNVTMTTTTADSARPQPMTKVYVSSVINAPAAEVWRVVRDFNALHKWTPFVAASRIEQNVPADQVGCVRNFRLKDGSLIREQLLALSDYDLSCTYSMLESPMGVENYVASLSLTPVTDGNATFAEWQAEFDCAPERESALVLQIRMDIFQAAFDALKEQLKR